MTEQPIEARDPRLSLDDALCGCGRLAVVTIVAKKPAELGFSVVMQPDMVETRVVCGACERPAREQVEAGSPEWTKECVCPPTLDVLTLATLEEMVAQLRRVAVAAEEMVEVVARLGRRDG